MRDALDPKQWCELCERNVERVELLIRRHGALKMSERVMVCPKCMSELVKAGLAEKSKWAKLDCYKLIRFNRVLDRSSAKPYAMELTPTEAHCLRALGFKVEQVVLTVQEQAWLEYMKGGEKR